MLHLIGIKKGIIVKWYGLIKEIHNSFYETLCRDIPPEDVELAEKTIGHMVENINRKIWHRMEES